MTSNSPHRPFQNKQSSRSKLTHSKTINYVIGSMDTPNSCSIVYYTHARGSNFCSEEEKNLYNEYLQFNKNYYNFESLINRTDILQR
jgi:hypothetical protein